MGESIETPGMTFLRRLDIAKENKTTLFAFLYQTIQKANPSEDSRNLMKKLAEISDLDAMAKYHGALAEFQIRRNEDAIQHSQKQLQGLRHLGENNFDYEAIMQRKIAVLSSFKPEVKDCIYLSMLRYIKDKNFGTAKDFKREFRSYVDAGSRMMFQRQQNIVDY